MYSPVFKATAESHLSCWALQHPFLTPLILMAFAGLPLAAVFPSLHPSAPMLCHPIRSGQMAARKTLKNRGTLILSVCPCLAIYSKMIFSKRTFSAHLMDSCRFHNWLQNCPVSGGHLPEGNNSAGQMSLGLWPKFNQLDSDTHLPAFMQGSGQTHWPLAGLRAAAPILRW